MVWLTDGLALRSFGDAVGCRRVAFSQAVWEQCVEVPEGVRCQGAGLRLWDLLVYLRAALWPNRPGGRSHAGLAFAAEVVNDERDWCDDPDAREWPPTTVWLLAVPDRDDEGSPCLVVTYPDEAPAR